MPPDAPSAAPAAAPAPTSAAPASTPAPSSAPAPATATDPKPSATPEAKPEPRRFKLHVNGAEREADEESVIRAAQRFMAGEDTLRKAAEERKAFEASRAKLKAAKTAEERAEALREMGLGDEDLTGFSVEWVKRQMEMERMDPRDKRIRELEAEQRKAEEARKAEEEKAAASTREAQTKATVEHYQKAIRPALEKVDMPVNEATVGLVAGAIRELAQGAADAGVTLDPNDLVSDAAEIAKERIGVFVNTHLGKLEGDALLKALGPIGEKVRKAHVAQYLAKKKAGQIQPPAPTRTTPPTNRGPMTQDEWRENLLRD